MTITWLTNLQEDSSPDVNGDIASDGAPEGSAAVKKPNHPTVPDKELALDLRPWMNRAPITVWVLLLRNRSKSEEIL